MLYKTMTLHLLEDRPRLHERLRQERKLLATLERLAQELRASHQAWQERLAQAEPQASPELITSRALELALGELEASLPAESPADEEEAPPLDEAMAFIRHTPPA